MIELFILGLIAGLFVGFYVGRRWAERGRARYDARKAMQARRGYRGTGPFWPF